MPALFTHYEFGQELLEKLDEKIRNDIEKSIEYYNMFNQGWDNLFYSPFHWKYYKRFGIKIHKKNVDEFFKNMILYIKNNHLENNSEITNMIYGFLNHYTVDTIIHPLVNYQVKNLNIPHSKIEFTIDTKLRSNNSNSFFKEVIPRLNFSDELLDFIDVVFLSTYNEKNVGKIFNRSHNTSYYLYRYFINDKYGIKANFYKIVDFLTPHKELKLHEFTYYVKNFESKILNEDNSTWHHPKNEDEIYTYSFYDLYNYALDICLKLDTILYNVLHNDGELEEPIKLIKKINVKNIQELL